MRYELEVEPLPELVGASFVVVAHVRSRTPAPPPAPTFRVTLDGAHVPLPQASAGADGTFRVEVALTGAMLPLGDLLPVQVEVFLFPLDPVVLDLHADNLPPRVRLEVQDRMVRRDQVVPMRVLAEDAHLADVRATLTADAEPPPPFEEWALGAGTGSARSYSIDTRRPAIPLPALEGELDAHGEALDSLGNVGRASAVVRMTRKAWSKSFPWTPIGSLTGAGNDVILTPPTVGFDRADGTVAWYADSDPRELPLAVAAAGTTIFGIQERALVSGLLTGDGFRPDPRCADLDWVESRPAAVRDAAGGTAAVSTYDGTESLVLVRRDDSGTCTSEKTGIPSRSSPTLTRDAAGRLQVLVASRDGSISIADLDDPDVFTTYDRAVGTGAFEVVPDGFTIFVQTDAAMEALEFRSFREEPLSKRIFPALRRQEGYDHHPIVTSDAVVVPGLEGLHALPRTGAWTESVLTPIESRNWGILAVVAGEGGWLYAVTGDARLVAFRPHGADEAAEEVWSAALGDLPLVDVHSSPVLGCDGIIVIRTDFDLHAFVTDSFGLDPTAPWPRYRHDNGSSGNAGAIQCP